MGPNYQDGVLSDFAFKTLYECMDACKCDARRCKNRVVQKGIQLPLQVFWTGSDKGWGLRCAIPVRKGTFICEYVGEVVTHQESERRAETEKGMW